MHGKHLIAGNWIGSENLFYNHPISGDADVFSVGDSQHVEQAVDAADKAFDAFASLSRTKRAIFIRTIADQIDLRGDLITTIGARETGLPTGRLDGERARTIYQLRLFAQHIEEGNYLDQRVDQALPDRKPIPRPDLRTMQRPIGPVAVFGASNFPLAFSTAGGDTASALAAGCPVIVKGHSAHPGTSEVVAEAILDAIEKCEIDPGVFSLIQGNNQSMGQALVTHPLIKAVGFTGSLSGGRALYDLCGQRPEPIPFFGELGSINPIFVMPTALETRCEEIAKGWASSLVLGAGQFCTNPGVIFLIDGANTDKFLKHVVAELASENSQLMLTDSIVENYRSSSHKMAEINGVNELLKPTFEGRKVGPGLSVTTGKYWTSNSGLNEEVFGPFGLAVSVRDESEMLSIARSLKGQLTCAIHLDNRDNNLASKLIPILERKAGRLLANGFPTGVEVCDSMVHGGPYPASTNFGHTSVGTLAIRRFVRPICYQNMPLDLLPTDMRDYEQRNG